MSVQTLRSRIRKVLASLTVAFALVALLLTVFALSFRVPTTQAAPPPPAVYPASAPLPPAIWPGDRAYAHGLENRVVSETSPWVPSQLASCSRVPAAERLDDVGNNLERVREQAAAGEVDLRANMVPDPGSPSPGSDYVYFLKVSNNAWTSTRDVRITDTLPSSVTVVSTWQPVGWGVDTSQPGRVVWQTSEMNGWSGTWVQLRLHVPENLPLGTQLVNDMTVSNSIPDANPDNNSQQHRAWVDQPRVNLWVGQWYYWGQPVAGHELKTSIRVDNGGSIPATDTVVTDTLPPGTRFVTSTVMLWNPATGEEDLEAPFAPSAQGPGWVRWQLGELLPWRPANIRLTLRIDDGVPTFTGLTNLAEANSSVPDENMIDNSAPYHFSTQPPGPNAHVETGYNWGSVLPGEILEYWVQLRNDGTSPVHDVWITDTLPAGVTFERHTFSQDPAIEGNQVVWHLDQMNPGDQQAWHVDARLDHSIGGGTRLTNTLQVRSATPEVRVDDNLTAMLLVAGPDLRVRKELLEPPRPGHEVRYRISYRNETPFQTPAYDAVLTDTLPAGMTYSWDGLGGIDQGDTVVWHLGTVEPGGGGSFEMGANLDWGTAPGTTLTNTIDISSRWGDANPADNHFLQLAVIADVLRVRVQETRNWAGGEAVPESSLNLILRAPDGSQKATVSGSADISGNWWLPFNVDIEPGDSLEVSSTGSSTVTIPIVKIVGVADAGDNVVAGRVYSATFPAEVRAEVWTPSAFGVRTQTDDAGSYSVSLAPFDLRPSHPVALWYVRPDGHEVGIVRSELSVRVRPTDNQVFGSTAPNTAVSLTVTAGGGSVIGTGQALSDDDGNWWGGVFSETKPAPIDAGNIVTVAASGTEANVSVPRIALLPDAVLDRLEILSDLPVGTVVDLRWDSQPDSPLPDLAHHTQATIGPTGAARVYFDVLGGLAPGIDGNLEYFDDNGNCVEPQWRAMVTGLEPASVPGYAARSITIRGRDFGNPRGPALLGLTGQTASSEALDLTLVDNSSMTFALASGTPPGTYWIQWENEDERTGYLMYTLEVTPPRWRLYVPSAVR